MNKIRTKLAGKRRRLGVSEVMGSVLLMGVTLAVGFAVWAWASNAAIASEKSFGNSVNSNSNCLQMSYTGVDVNFSSTSSSLLTVWFYNNGQSEITLRTIIISNSTWIYTYTPASSTIFYVQNIYPITVNVGTNLAKNAIYTFKSLGGNTTTVGSGKSAVSYSCGVSSSVYQQVTPDATPI